MSEDKMTRAESKEIVDTYLDYLSMHKIVDRSPGKSALSIDFLTDIITCIIDDKMSKVDALMLTLARYIGHQPGMSRETVEKDVLNSLRLIKILNVEGIVDTYLAAYENGYEEQ